MLYFKAKNGTFKRVPQRAQQGIESTQGGMMVYYMSDALFDQAQKSKVTAFKPGFRMLVGNVNYNNREEARNFRQLTYICMQNEGTREPETINFPNKPCPAGIMANHRVSLYTLDQRAMAISVVSVPNGNSSQHAGTV